MFLSNSSESTGSFKSLKTILIIGAVFFVFSKDMVSDFRQVMKARTVTATIVDRTQNCRLVVRHSNKKRTRKEMACDEAYALKRADESSKTRVYKRTYVTLSYTLENGTQHTTRVRERKVRARNKAVGSQIQVAYSKRNPNTVTLPKSWWKVTKSALFVVASMIALMVFLFGYQKLQSLFDRFKKSMEKTAHQAQSRRGRSDILARIEENFGAETAAAVLGPSSVSTPSPRPPRKPSKTRVHKKTSPIPKTGGVVSKRRRGLFS